MSSASTSYSPPSVADFGHVSAAEVSPLTLEEIEENMRRLRAEAEALIAVKEGIARKYYVHKRSAYDVDILTEERYLAILPEEGRSDYCTLASLGFKQDDILQYLDLCRQIEEEPDFAPPPLSKPVVDMTPTELRCQRLNFERNEFLRRIRFALTRGPLQRCNAEPYY
jgi:hypothetical protein